MKDKDLLNKKIYDEAFLSTRIIKLLNILAWLHFKIYWNNGKNSPICPKFCRTGINEIKELLNSFSLSLGNNFEEYQDNQQSYRNNKIDNENTPDGVKQNVPNIEDLKF